MGKKKIPATDVFGECLELIHDCMSASSRMYTCDMKDWNKAYKKFQKTHSLMCDFLRKHLNKEGYTCR